MKNLAIAVALSGLVAVPVAEAAPNDIQRARAAIRRVLKDPEAARFSGEFTNTRGAVCGFVNMKNSYGGYVGDKRYVYMIATGQFAVIENPGGTSAEDDRAFQLGMNCL